jgi:hypothetical protein
VAVAALRLKAALVPFTAFQVQVVAAELDPPLTTVVAAAQAAAVPRTTTLGLVLAHLVKVITAAPVYMATTEPQVAVVVKVLSVGLVTVTAQVTAALALHHLLLVHQ